VEGPAVSPFLLTTPTLAITIPMSSWPAGMDMQCALRVSKIFPSEPRAAISASKWCNRLSYESPSLQIPGAKPLGGFSRSARGSSGDKECVF
jgi:hypothetical protein